MATLGGATKTELQATATQRTQGRLYGLEYMSMGERSQASIGTRSTHPDFKEKCSRDRAWLRNAYLQEYHTESPENQPHSASSDRTMRSKQQTEPKRDGDLITKRSPLNKKSAETFTGAAGGSPTKSNNKVLPQLQTSKVEVDESKDKFAENTEANEYHDRSLKEIVNLLSQNKRLEKSHEMDSAARNTDNEVTLREKPVASTKEETKASSVYLSTKSSTASIVTETGSTKTTPTEDPSMNSQSFWVKGKGFPNQNSFTERHVRKVCSGTERRLTKRDKSLTKQASLQRTPGLETVTLKRHHSAQCRKDRGKLINCNSNTTKKASGKAPPNNIVSINPRDAVHNKSSDTAKGGESMEGRPVEINKGIQLWREQGEYQRSKINLNQRKAHNRPVNELVTKHPHQNIFTIYDAKRKTKLHFENAPMQKDENTNYGMEKHAEKNKHKEAIEELPPCMKNASKVESVESVIHYSTNTDKAPPLKHKSDDRLGRPNFAQAMDSKSVTTTTWKQNQLREAKLLEPVPKQSSANLKVGDPDSTTERVVTSKENKVTSWQHTPSTDTFEEGSEKPRWNQRKNSTKQGACQVSKDEPDNNIQADTCSNQSESEPQLPERGYLEDIDFVVNEFDMIIRTKPELPARAYLEDIDFVCKEFEFFFRRKSSKDRLEEKQKVADCSANASETLELTSEANGLLNSEETPEDEDDDYNFLSQLSVLDTNPCDNFQEPADSFNQCSTPDVYINYPLMKQPHTSAESATSCVENESSESQYQPLISTTMQDPVNSRLYDHVAFRAPRPPRSLLPPRSQLQGTVKSKKDQDIYDDVHVTASHTMTTDENHYQPLLFDGERDLEEEYCIPFTQPLLSAENKYCNVHQPSLMGQQPLRSSQFLSTCMTLKSHGNANSHSSRAEPVHQLHVTTAIVSREYQFKDH